MPTIRMKITIPKSSLSELKALAQEENFTYNLKPNAGTNCYHGVLLMKDCKIFARAFYAMGKERFSVKV